MSSFVLHLPEDLVLFSRWTLYKPSQYLGRFEVCFQAWSAWVVLFGFWLCFPPQVLNLINNCVLFFFFKWLYVFPQVKLWTHLLFQGRAWVMETEEYCRLYHVPSWCVSGYTFFHQLEKLKRDIWLDYILYINLCINGSLFSWATV